MARSELIIQSGSNIYDCAIEAGVTLELSRRKTPSKLTFKVLKQHISFEEGDAVRFSYDGVALFYGFVFTKKRSDLDTITVTAYDQLRYLKNKDTYVYENKTAAQLIKMIATDFRLNVGSITDTKHRIASGADDNKELFEIIQNALDDTSASTGEIYVLYDEVGKLTLKNISELKLDFLIDEESGEKFDYTSSIDSDTYNKIKLVKEDKKTGARELFIAQDSRNMNKWGVLQLTESIDESTNGKAKADTLLTLHNRKSRTLNFDSVFGDKRVRAGSLIPISIELGDMIVANYMIVDNVKHTFNESEYKMNLRLIGGEFNA